MTPEAEKKLQYELAELLAKNPECNYREIARILKFGIPSSPYKKLKVDHIYHYLERFNFVQYNYGRTKSLQSHIDRQQLAEEWDKFDGTWTEFKRYIAENF